MYPNSTLKRFWNKVKVGLPDECWEWHGKRNNDGYGILRLTPHKDIRAHRMSWSIVNGPIPEKMCICHHCDNPSCQNPKHLFLGTLADNIRDAMWKGRLNQQGINHSQNKITEAAVVLIRNLYSTSNYCQKDIAGLFGITQSQVSHIVTRKQWRHVP